MSAVTDKTLFIFHTDLGPVISQVSTVQRYDVEDIISDRAHSQALRLRFVALGKAASPNDPKAARTITSTFTSNTEELAS